MCPWPGGGVHPGATWLPILALLALLVLDVSVSAQFPVPWGGPLTLRGAASFCLDFAPRPEVVDGIWQRPEWPWKTLPASDSAGAETAAYQDEAGKRYTGFMLQTLGLPLPGDYGQVPAKLWYLHKV